MEIELFIHSLEGVLENIVNIVIIVLELMGVWIIFASGIKGFKNYINHSPETKRSLAQGLAMALEFKMGSEILRTVVVREWEEIVTVAGIIALRALLAFLIHWEIKEEEETMKILSESVKEKNEEKNKE